MKKKFQETLSKIVFSLFFIYVVILGILNILFSFHKNKIELLIANLLSADKVEIGNISNLPLIFVSLSKLKITVKEDFFLDVERIYLNYRIWKLFSQNYQNFIREFRIHSIEFQGHSMEIKDYILMLRDRYQTEDIKLDLSQKGSQKNFSLKSSSFLVNIDEIQVVINSLTLFWHKFFFDSLKIEMKDGELMWNGDFTMESIWSNTVFLMGAKTSTKGYIKEFDTPNIDVSCDISEMNIGGIPFIKEKSYFSIIHTNNTTQVRLLDPSDSINLDSNNRKNLKINRSIPIFYKDFEEYYILDYLFAPANWDFSFNLDTTEDFFLDMNFTSSEHPTYGVNLNVVPKNDKYIINLDLKTHFFGSIFGDLEVDKNWSPHIFPMPSGNLILDNVRFILAGLVFSGDAKINAGKTNQLDITGKNVKMNGGLIGDTAVTFDFNNLPTVTIKPRPMDNKAVDVYASLGETINVNLKALDVDGDFVASNIKIPIFGLKESRYKGVIDIFKSKKSRGLIALTAEIKGYLDEEEQIDCLLNLDGTKILVPRLYFWDQNLLFEGSVDIFANRSNTYINIEADAFFRKNDLISVDLYLDIGKYKIKGVGSIDGIIPLILDGSLTDIDFSANFEKYSLKKLSLPGELTAFLFMHFSPEGITQFTVRDLDWKILNRNVTLDFNAKGLPEKLITENIKLGIDKELLVGTGYFSFLPMQTQAAFVFQKGSWQFNIARYTVQSKIYLKGLEVDNLFDLPIVSNFNFLSNRNTETVKINVDTFISGIWSDLNYEGNLRVDSLEKGFFVFAVPKFSKKGKIYQIEDLRLRHSLMNLDLSMLMTNIQNTWDINAKGSYVLSGILKTDFVAQIIHNTDNSTIKYDLPNAYILSKIPMRLLGNITRSKNNFLFQSVFPGEGLSGTFSYQDQRNFIWDLLFSTENSIFTSKGNLKNNTILAGLNYHVNLTKIKPSGSIRKVKGTLGLDLILTGDIDNPVFDGTILLDNITIGIKALRNNLNIPTKSYIPITRNLVVFPKIPIQASRGGKFYLDGSVLIQDRGVGNADLRFFADPLYTKDPFLNWNLSVPFLSMKGNTLIQEIKITGGFDDIILSGELATENLTLGLELGDSLNNLTFKGANKIEINPFLALLAGTTLDIKVDVSQRTRFSNQLFDLQFKQVEPITVKGKLGEGSISIGGYLDITKGHINYLSNRLKLSSGSMQFSGETGDFFPYINLSTETTERTFQNESIDIYADFEGKIPNIELVRISSSPMKSSSELYSLLGMGGSSASSTTGSSDSVKLSQNVLRGSIGVVENMFFTAPLSRQIRKVVPFIDTFTIKTDLLGNLSRSLSDGIPLTGISILSGSEIEIGQYIPGLQGIQMKYNLRLESPGTGGFHMGSSLDRIHKGGLEWTYVLPMQTQIGLGASVLGEEKVVQQNQTVEVMGELSLKKRF